MWFWYVIWLTVWYTIHVHKRCDSGMSYGWQSDIKDVKSDIQYIYIKDVILVCQLVDSLIYTYIKDVILVCQYTDVIWLTVWYTIHIHKRCDSGMSYGWQSDIQYMYIKDVILVCHMVNSLIYNTRHIKYVFHIKDVILVCHMIDSLIYNTRHIKDVILVCQLVDSLIYNTRRIKRCDSGMTYGWQSDIQYTSHIQYTYIKDVILVCHMVDSLIYNTCT